MKHTTEQELMEAFAHEALEMPDIEKELKRVKSQTPSQQLRYNIPSPFRGRWRGAVACILLIVGLATIGLSRSGEGEELCIAYVGGERITDEAAVMRLMASDMHEMDTADDIVAAQLNDIFNE